MINFNNPAVIGLIVAIPSFILGYLAYRRSIKVDRFTEQTGFAASQTGALAQVINGLNQLIDNLQEDNQVLRDNLRDIRKRLDEITLERLAFIKEIDNLRFELQQTKKRATEEVRAKVDGVKEELHTSVDQSVDKLKRP